MAICVFVHLILKVSPCQPVDACEEKLAAETASTAINAQSIVQACLLCWVFSPDVLANLLLVIRFLHFYGAAVCSTL